ncbi:8-amino-7-oxononanoate synthase 2 [Legionella massiliensis]|uniref:8-amino-7-oxononanoate synthase 2 n=1 Tax=Legionella massiliensis TaxID=1034943 RepID=A0A078L398_9GAMM|nr:aminotransferase class I/II-fold pyridoxal phosphate-dependent enzyme [Legionella massiliensis]CDZ78413.1 8-amino-7-oxononanoate synthase 2 [Legionella massiliensis]CEE14151.1 8-amino-7-oxononanoate synthase 2 [Legionella massiliensis]
MISSALSEHLSLLKKQGLHRERMLADSSDRGISFSSSDYLSLTQEKQVREAFQRGFSKYPSGSGGSMVICGYHKSHRALEQAFSEALSVDDALLFSSGYAANLGLVSLLAHFNSHIIIDKAAHASFYDGLHLNDSSYSRYLHNDLANLQTKLDERPVNPVVIAESVFSMSGQTTNLSALSELCWRYEADCLVDEAHAFGVFGPQGLGAVMQHGLGQEQIPLRVFPLGKAFAFQGAIVAGRGEWIDALLQFARSHRYSTAVSPALAYGMTEVLTFIRSADERRQKLFHLIDYFQKLRESSSLTWRASKTPIQQLQLGCPHKALSYASFLREKGIFCQAMREPTVSRKDTGLRVILNYQHEPEDLDKLFYFLNLIAAGTLEQRYESAH